MLRFVSLLVALGVSSWVACAQSKPTATPAPPAKAPAGMLPHDRHDGLTIQVDPYLEPARAKEKFGKANPVEAGILPLEVIMQNDTEQPIRVKLDAIQLEVRLRNGARQDIDWLSAEETAVLIAHPGGNPSSPGQRRSPVPLGIPVGDKKAEKIAAALRPFTLDADIVPPMGKIQGFLYFNLGRDMELAPKSSLYVPDLVIIPSNKVMIFFDVPLSAAAEP
jgi:hypothetical protein